MTLHEICSTSHSVRVGAQVHRSRVLYIVHSTYTVLLSEVCRVEEGSIDHKATHSMDLIQEIVSRLCSGDHHKGIGR